MVLQKEIAWEHRNLTEAQDRLSQKLQHEIQESIGLRLIPITNALKSIKEVAVDLRGIVDAVIRYAESSEPKCEGIPNESRMCNRKRRRNQTPWEGCSDRSQIHEQPPKQDVKYRDYEKAMQEA